LVSLRATTRRASRLSEGLIVGQVVLCSVLLCVAGLFARSLTNLRNLDLGFQSARVLVGRLVSQPRISINLDRATYSRDLLTLVARQPGVDSAALVHLFPAPIINAQAVGSADASDHSMDVTAALDQVSPGFFRTVGMSLVAGRDFQWGDDIRSRPVAIVSADLARRIFPRGDAIGRHIHIGAEPKDQSAEVVGIVSDARLGDIRQSPPPAVFRPLLQEPMYQPIPVLVVRTETAPLALADVARKAVSSLGQEYAPNLSTLDEQVNESLLQERILAIVSWLFAGLALLLGLLGLFALLAHTVALRTREIGVRVALGATAGRLVRAVMLQGLTLTGIGVAVGVPTAIAAARFVRSLLFSLSPSDPLTVGFTALALLAVGPLAAWWPARAAARVDPVTALRAE
jgi:predicted permease